MIGTKVLQYHVATMIDNDISGIITINIKFW